MMSLDSVLNSLALTWSIQSEQQPQVGLLYTIIASLVFSSGFSSDCITVSAPTAATKSNDTIPIPARSCLVPSFFLLTVASFLRLALF